MLECAPMKVIVVTGGIASGKSTVVELLTTLGGKGMEIFDCDGAVEELQRTGKLSRDLVSAFGPDALDARGSVNKELLRDLVRHDPEARRKLEEITHPKVARLCMEAVAEARQREDVHTFLVDIPLYYESRVEWGADLVCVVATTPQTQVERMMQRDGCSREEAEEMLAVQMPTQDKIDKADVVFWNEGNRERLEAQVQAFFASELADEARAVQARATVVDLNELRQRPLHELQHLAATLPKRGISSLARPCLLYTSPSPRD